MIFRSVAFLTFLAPANRFFLFYTTTGAPQLSLHCVRGERTVALGGKWAKSKPEGGPTMPGLRPPLGLCCGRPLSAAREISGPRYAARE